MVTVTDSRLLHANAKAFAKHLYAVLPSVDLETAFDLCDHILTYVTNDQLLHMRDYATDRVNEIPTNHWSSNISMRLRSFGNTAERHLKLRMEYGNNSKRIREIVEYPDGDDCQDIFEFIEYDCGINSVWNTKVCVTHITANDLTSIPDNLLLTEFSYIDDEFIKWHWSLEKRTKIASWIEKYKPALLAELKNRLAKRDVGPGFNWTNDEFEKRIAALE